MIALHEGLSLSTERDLAAESAHMDSVLDALPFLAGTDSGDAAWRSPARRWRTAWPTCGPS